MFRVWGVGLVGCWSKALMDLLNDCQESCLQFSNMGGFPKIRDPCWGVPITRTRVVWGLYWGPLIRDHMNLWKSPYGP